MPRIPVLSFDRGTLILHPPPRGKAWAAFVAWDDRIEKFRIPAIQYSRLIEALKADGAVFDDQAKQFQPLELLPSLERQPYPHQEEALAAWQQAGRQGVVVLPTAAGKTYLAQMAMQATPRSSLIVVPTLDLMHQWYAHLLAAFPDATIGLLGGGSRDRTPILIATYDSAAIHAETLGSQYALLIFDECHHLPSSFNRVIADYAIAPYRLGLTATPDRADGKQTDLTYLVGNIVYRKTVEDLAGTTLAQHEIVRLNIKLSQQERDRYKEQIQIRDQFLQTSKIWLNNSQGWQRFVQASARSQAGRRAMLAHRQAKEIALGTAGKLRVLADLLATHYADRTLIFTNDNATVYRVSREFLIPAITHQTPVKERHQILTLFRQGDYNTLITSHVLDEGVDVPEARIAIILSGTASRREFIQRLGRILRKGATPDKQAILYELVAESTTEEKLADRRREPHASTPTTTKPRQPDNSNVIPLVKPAPDPSEPLQLPLYGLASSTTSKAAEPIEPWPSEPDCDED